MYNFFGIANSAVFGTFAIQDPDRIGFFDIKAICPKPLPDPALKTVVPKSKSPASGFFFHPTLSTLVEY